MSRTAGRPVHPATVTDRPWGPVPSHDLVRHSARWWTRAAARGSALSLPVVLLAGCSITAQDHPQAVEVGPLTASLRPAPAAGDSTARTAVVFFLRDDRLVAVTRTLAAGDPLDGAIESLVAGPSDQDSPGLRTALPANVTSLRVTTTAGVATIEVPGSFNRVGARNEVLAVGQIVFTAMAQPGVNGVRLSSGGVPIEVPVDSGRLVARPVTRSDYPSIAPV